VAADRTAADTTNLQIVWLHRDCKT